MNDVRGAVIRTFARNGSAILTSRASPEGTAEVKWIQPFLFQTQPRTDVLGYFQVVPSGLDVKAG